MDQEVSGLDRAELAEVRNQTLGFVFQSFNLLSRTSAVENVELPLVYAGVGRKERHERARKALERMGLGKRLDHRPSQLSGGQQQRVAIARAIVNAPKVILADEPTGNLDSRTSIEVIALFQELWASGLTIMVVTHEPDIAEFASRTVVVKDGKIRLRRAADASPRGAVTLEREPRVNLLQTFPVAMRALARNKTRSFLTMLGVVIGVASVISMVAIGEGAKAGVESVFNAMGTNLLIVLSGSTRSGGVMGGFGSMPSLTWDDLAARFGPRSRPSRQRRRS